MASILDSEAEFTKRCSELLPDDQKDKLQAQDVKTFGTLAFSVAEQPDKISDTKLNEVLTKAFGANASIGVTAAVRRLAFEGLTYSLQDIRIRSELDHAATRPVPTGEREDLRKTQVTKLKGILIEGELEPAFALVDKAAAMLRDGVVRYLAPSSCISRDQELQSTKRDRDIWREASCQSRRKTRPSPPA